MSFAMSAPCRLGFEEFLDTPPGQLLLSWERAQYAELVEDAFGDAALQVGCPWLPTLANNRIRSRWLAAPDLEDGKVQADHQELGFIEAQPEALPVANDSIDLLTLPHVLDFSSEPQQALREAVRILQPEGRLILTVFNPLGLWWLRQHAVAVGIRPYLPTALSPISISRLRDWLTLLGLEIDRGRFGIYAPAFASAKRLASWRWIDKAGDRWAPQLSNLILLSAVKHSPGASMICFPERKKQALAVAGSSVPAASSSLSHKTNKL